MTPILHINNNNTNSKHSIVQVMWIVQTVLLLLLSVSDNNTIVYVTAEGSTESISINSDGSIETVATQNTEKKIINNVIISKHSELKKMPNYDFEAFVRPPISSYYRNTSTTSSSTDDNNMYNNEKDPDYKGVAGRFINMSPYKTSLYWIGEEGGVSYIDEPILMDELLQPWGSGGTASYPTHIFIITDYSKPKNIICTLTVQPKICTYYCDPYINDNTTTTTATTTTNNGAFIKNKDTYISSRAGIVTPGRELTISSLYKNKKTKDLDNYNTLVQNLIFADEYYKFTNGSPWLTNYPPVPVKMNIWPTEYFHQTHTVTTSETHFIKPIPTKLNRKLSLSEMSYHPLSTSTVSSTNSLKEYRTNEVTQTFTLKVVSCMPKVLEISNFLSVVEIEHMLNIVQKLQYERSSTNGGVLETRTSRTTWINRNKDPIVNTIHRRAADVLGIHESLLRDRTRTENDSIPKNYTNIHMPTKQLGKTNEDLQIVHYNPNQEYEAHHDFGYPDSIGLQYQLDRYVNIALYLNNVTDGGYTSFPRYRSATSSDILKVQPIAGKAVIFYMSLPDGNFDDLSQHAGMPVITGEKYFVNLWVRTFL